MQSRGILRPAYQSLATMGSGGARGGMGCGADSSSSGSGNTGSGASGDEGGGSLGVGLSDCMPRQRFVGSFVAALTARQFLERRLRRRTGDLPFPTRGPNSQFSLALELSPRSGSGTRCRRDDEIQAHQ